MDGRIEGEIVQALRLAPFDAAYWPVAIEAAAAACGAASGQILAYSRSGIPTLMAPGFTADDIGSYLTLGGGDPAINRGMAFMTSPRATPLRPYADHEYLTEDERRRDLLYNEFFGPRDGSHISVGVMVRKPALTANLSFLRTTPMEQDDRQATARLLPLFARACDLQFALEGRAAAILSQALDSLGDAVLICDASGHLVSATRRGEAVLSTGRFLALKHGRLTCAEPAQAPELERLLDHCAVLRNQLGLGGGFALRAPDGAAARVDVAPVPAERGDSALRPLAMVRIREVSDRARLDLDHLMAAFGLTWAEAEVAEALMGGLSSRVIAEHRGVAQVTVDSQVRAILAKTGCGRRAELPVLLAPFVLH